MAVENPEELQAVLATLDPTTRSLIGEADLAEQTVEWLRSPVGAYIIGCAKQEIADAQDELSRVAPWRRRKIQDLQNKVWRATQLLAWLRELVLGGHVAHQALLEKEDE